MEFESVEMLSDYLGVLPSWIYLVIVFVATLAITLFTLLSTRSILLSSISMIGCLLLSSFLGFVPFWVIFPPIASIVFYIFYYTPNPDVDIELSDGSDYWSEYAIRMKRAYSAKYGGENTGFNSEVDKRIDVMRNMKRGITQTVAREWLKRMERFTEMK